MKTVCSVGEIRDRFTITVLLNPSGVRAWIASGAGAMYG